MQKLKKDLSRYKKRDSLRKNKTRCTNGTRTYTKAIITDDILKKVQENLVPDPGRCIRSETPSIQKDVPDVRVSSPDNESIYGVSDLARCQVPLLTADENPQDNPYLRNICLAEYPYINKQPAAKDSFGNLVENHVDGSFRDKDNRLRTQLKQGELFRPQFANSQILGFQKTYGSKCPCDNCLKNSLPISSRSGNDKKNFGKIFAGNGNRSTLEVSSLPEKDYFGNHEFSITTPLLDSVGVKSGKTSSDPVMVHSNRQLNNSQPLCHRGFQPIKYCNHSIATAVLQPRNLPVCPSETLPNQCTKTLKATKIDQGCNHALVVQPNQRHTIITKL